MTCPLTRSTSATLATHRYWGRWAHRSFVASLQLPIEVSPSVAAAAATAAAIACGQPLHLQFVCLRLLSRMLP